MFSSDSLSHKISFFMQSSISSADLYDLLILFDTYAAYSQQHTTKHFLSITISSVMEVGLEGITYYKLSKNDAGRLWELDLHLLAPRILSIGRYKCL